MKPAFAIVTLLVAGDRGPATLPADPRGDGPPRLGLGASGLVFGFATYLVARGAYRRSADWASGTLVRPEEPYSSAWASRR